MPILRLPPFAAMGDRYVASEDSFGFQEQTPDEAFVRRLGADHPNLTPRQGRHSAVTLAGGTALPFWSRSR